MKVTVQSAAGALDMELSEDMVSPPLPPRPSTNAPSGIIWAHRGTTPAFSFSFGFQTNYVAPPLREVIPAPSLPRHGGSMATAITISPQPAGEAGGGGRPPWHAVPPSALSSSQGCPCSCPAGSSSSSLELLV